MAGRIRAVVGAEAKVIDIRTSRRIVGSSLTAVDLAGLTKVELGFALVLAAAATGLVLALGLAERRRMFVIAGALGARPRQLGGFIWAEAAFVTLGGLFTGAIAGWALAVMLVKVLAGVFDPPPATLAVPGRTSAASSAWRSSRWRWPRTEPSPRSVGPRSPWSATCEQVRLARGARRFR